MLKKNKLEEAHMKRLATYCIMTVLAALLAAPVAHAAPDATAPPAAGTSKKAKKAWPGQENLLDINTATIEQLKALPGLSADDSAKIIAGRPYTRKNQLKQKNIITAATYDGIKDQIVAKKMVK
jgi:competence protein ComEA